MPTQRKIVLTNGFYYHVFNRGIDRRATFTDVREYRRALELLYFYQFARIPISYSHYIQLPRAIKEEYTKRIHALTRQVEIVSYCLMPNHFHLLIRQTDDKGIQTYLSNFLNAYTRYFNKRHERKGPLFEGTFKSVLIDSDEQLIHVSRYIHLNPVVASLVEKDSITNYKWSSLSHYLSLSQDDVVSQAQVDLLLELVPNYSEFVVNHIRYAQELHMIKHLALE